MRSFFENKRLVLLLAILALGALTVLAISLNEVPFREGRHFGRNGETNFQIATQDISQIWIQVPIWKQILVWILAGLMVVLIGLLLSPEMRKRMLLIFIRVGFTFWALYFLIKKGLFNFNILGGGEAAPSQDATVPMPVFEPPQVSPTFSYLISFAFALIWIGVVWALYRGWKRYVSLNSQKPLEEIAKIARSSLNDLSAGRNSSDVIINCYLRMSDVVASKRHLHRNIAMTPHEFALHLEQAGLPGDAVTRLTRLFEGVRYGDRKSGPQDINEAVSCLKTILHYCGEPV
jgi:Domain of unknown function (DUF4129)